MTVRVDEDLRSLRGGIFSGAFAGVFLLFLPVIALVARAGVPYALLGWLLVAYLAAWILYGKRFAAREAQLRALVTEVLAVVGAPRPRVAAGDDAPGMARIAVQGEAEREETAEEAGGPSARYRRQ